MLAVDSIARLPVFRVVPRSSLHALLQITSPLRYAPGEVLMRQGEDAIGAIFIIEGRCRIELDRAGAPLPIGHALAGELVGEAGLFIRGAVRSATVVAEEPVEALLLYPSALVDPAAHEAMSAIEQRALHLVAERLSRTLTRERSQRPPAAQPHQAPARTSAPEIGLIERLRQIWG
jgi:CRP-like cAMP-binding protein